MKFFKGSTFLVLKSSDNCCNHGKTFLRSLMLAEKFQFLSVLEVSSLNELHEERLSLWGEC